HNEPREGGEDRIQNGDLAFAEADVHQQIDKRLQGAEEGEAEPRHRILRDENRAMMDSKLRESNHDHAAGAKQMRNYERLDVSDRVDGLFGQKIAESPAKHAEESGNHRDG